MVLKGKRSNFRRNRALSQNSVRAITEPSGGLIGQFFLQLYIINIYKYIVVLLLFLGEGGGGGGGGGQVNRFHR